MKNKNKLRKQSFRMTAIVAVITIGFVALSIMSCDGDGDGSGSDTNWNGVYTSVWGDPTEKTTVDLTTGTITGGRPIIEDYYYHKGDYDPNLKIENVTLGTIQTLPTTGTDIKHSGKWAYVYQGDDKIGFIYSWTMSAGGSMGYNETGYNLEIHYDKNNMSFPSPWPNPLDLDDLVDIGVHIDVEKDG